MKLLLSLSVIIGAIITASSLSCNVCKFRFLSFCFSTASVTDCSGNCSVTKAYAGTTFLFTKQACDASCVSNSTTQTDAIFSLDYQKSCCNTDLCNSGNSAKISLSLGLSVLLLWLLKSA